VLFLRHNPAGQKDLTRSGKTHGKGKALTVFAQKLARAVDSMLKRDTAFDLDNFRNEERSGRAHGGAGPSGDQPGDRARMPETRRHGTRLST
jgi:hypothetical protein